MTFYPITQTTYSSSQLQQDYKNARAFGVVRVGAEVLYFRVKLKVYYIPYQELTRCFRRVQLVPAKMCCGGGNFQIENLVLYGAQGELAQIQLPGTRAARALMEELKARAPHADFSAVAKESEQES